MITYRNYAYLSHVFKRVVEGKEVCYVCNKHIDRILLGFCYNCYIRVCSECEITTNPWTKGPCCIRCIGNEL